MKWVLLLAILLALSTAAAQTTEETATQTTERDWLIMVYMDGDNNLEGAAIDDINEMERGLQMAIDQEANNRIESAKASGTTVTPEMEEQIRQQAAQDVTSRATVVVQVDRWGGELPDGYPWYYSLYDNKSNGDWTGTRRYVITPGVKDGEIESTMVMDLGEVNMGDPNNAIDFVAWATENYAANNTALIYWNHGSGWKWEESEVTQSEQTKSVGADWTNGGDSLTPLELETNHASLPKQDIIGFDACLMQMAEHAYQYQDHASIIIGSEEVEPGDGWTYDPIIAAAFSGASPEELAKTVVGTYSGATLSAIDTQKVANITNSLDALLQELNAAKNDGKVLKAYEEALRFRDPEYGDIYTFADNIEKAGLGENVTAAAKALKDSVDGAVIAKHNEAGYEEAGGISIWMPLERDETNFANYPGLGISEDTKWDESVTHLVEQNEALRTTGSVVGYDGWW